MKKILLITALLFIFNDAKPQSIQQDLTVTRNSDISPLRLDRLIKVYYDENTLWYKRDAVFDANGNQTLVIDYQWNTDTQSFLPSGKYEYTRDANANLTLGIIFYTWNTNTQTFIPDNKYEYTYDTNGNRTLFIDYSWNTDTQSFVPNYKYEYTYDVNRNQTLLLSYSWNTDTQSFVPYYKSEYTYDANGNQTLKIYYTWNTDTQSFVPDRKDESTYDANGNRTLAIYYYWNTTTQSFVPDRKDEHTFDANGNPILYIVYFWDTTTQSFIPRGKRESTYDANGNSTLTLSYSWNTDTQSFVPYYKYEYTYDANGNLILYISYSWDTTTQSFVPISKDVRTFNNGLPITFLTQKTIYKWYTGLGVYKPSFKTEYATILDTDTQLVRKGVLYRYDTNFNVWNELVGDEYNSYDYYTKNSTLSNETMENNLTLLYPNPVINVLNVKVDNNLINQPYNVFDSLGRVIIKGKLNDVENTINVEQLSKGIYYLKVSDNTASKFIKE